MQDTQAFDIVVAGGNYVGLTTALAIRTYAPGPVSYTHLRAHET